MAEPTAAEIAAARTKLAEVDTFLAGLVPPPPTAALTAAPTEIVAGQSVTLTWETTGATFVHIVGLSDEDVGASGTRVVTDLSVGQATFELVATGPGGEARDAVDVTVSAPPPIVQFVGEDATTQGTWPAAYGADGRLLASHPTEAAGIPVTRTGVTRFVWATATPDVRATVHSPDDPARMAATFYGTDMSFVVDAPADRETLVAFYVLDWDTTARVMRVTATQGGTVLDQRDVKDFKPGKWLVWRVVGPTTFRFVRVSGVNAVVSAVALGGPVSVGPPPPTPAPTVGITVSPAQIEDSHDGTHAATLRWTTLDATSAQINGESVALSGEKQVVGLPIGIHRFTLVAAGLGGETTAFDELEVIPHSHLPPPPGPVHPDDEAMRIEHEQAMLRVTPEAASLYAPAAQTTTVTSGRVDMGARADGELFVPAGTDWHVETVIGNVAANLKIGTPENPATWQNPVRIVIRDTGPMDPVADPLLIGRGIVWHGSAESYAVGVQPYAWCATDPTKDATTITMASVITNWDVGQTVVVADMNRTLRGREFHEVRKITAVSGNVVTLDAPLLHDHRTLNDLAGKLVSEPLVLNLSQPITIRSENPALDRRGHAMFMHTNRCKLRGVAFWDMGRTDKKRVVTDPKLDGTGQENVRGRYACHFHRAGGKLGDPSATLEYFAVWGSPGLGVVNHSSNLVARHGATFDILGSHLFGEDGDELGAFEDCACVLAEGSGGPGNIFAEGDHPRLAAHDFGNLGHALWAQGGGIKFRRVYGCGFRDAFIGIIGRAGPTARPFPVSNLDPEVRAVVPASVTKLVPHQTPFTFEEIVAWGCVSGFTTWQIANLPFTPDPAFDSHIDNCRFANQITHGYSGHFHYRDTNFSGLGHTLINYGQTYERVSVASGGNGIHLTMEDFNQSDRPFPAPGRPAVIDACEFRCPTALLRQNTQYRKRTIIDKDNHVFHTVPATELGNKTQWDRHASLEFFGFRMAHLVPTGAVAAFWRLFAFDFPIVHPEDVYHLGDKYFSYGEMDPDYSWGWAKAIPDVFRLKADGTARTTADYANDFAWYVGGQAIDGPVERRPRNFGVIHDAPAVPLPPLQVLSLKVTDAEVYTFRVRDAAGNEIQSEPTPLVLGWNNIIVTVDGRRRGFPIQRVAAREPVVGQWPETHGTKGYAIPGGAEWFPAGASAKFLVDLQPWSVSVQKFPADDDPSAIVAERGSTLRIASQWTGGYVQTLEVRPAGATRLTLYYRDFGGISGPPGTAQAVVTMTGPDGKVIGTPVTTTDFAAGKFVPFDLPAGVEFIRLTLTKPHTVFGQFTLSGVFLD